MNGTDKIDRFHAHLDSCEQCRNHPFDLCPLGAAYLEVAARVGIMESLRQKNTRQTQGGESK